MISGLFTSAQEAIGASWAAATAEGGDTNTSDSEYLSVNDSLQTVCTDSSRKTGARASGQGQSTDTRRTSVKRRRNSSSSTSTSSLEDYRTPASRPRQTPAPRTTSSGSTSPTPSPREAIALSRLPGRGPLIGSGPVETSTPATPCLLYTSPSPRD